MTSVTPFLHKSLWIFVFFGHFKTAATHINASLLLDKLDKLYSSKLVLQNAVCFFITVPQNLVLKCPNHPFKFLSQTRVSGLFVERTSCRQISNQSFDLYVLLLSFPWVSSFSTSHHQTCSHHWIQEERRTGPLKLRFGNQLQDGVLLLCGQSQCFSVGSCVGILFPESSEVKRQGKHFLGFSSLPPDGDILKYPSVSQMFVTKSAVVEVMSTCPPAHPLSLSVVCSSLILLERNWIHPHFLVEAVIHASHLTVFYLKDLKVKIKTSCKNRHF